MRKEVKILFTSVGRRVELVQAFRDAAVRLGVELSVYGADMSESAPALQFCDKTVMVPRIKDSEYIPVLLEVCKKEQIAVLIPTIDTDLLLLAEHKADFAEIGTQVLISAPDKIVLCRDKRFTASYFRSVGLHSPVPVDCVADYQGGFPAFIKPKDGSSSINAFKVKNHSELVEYAERVPDYIIQPFVDGDEYTVDIFCDFSGEPIFITPRERLAVRSGEVLKTKISQDEQIIREMRTLVADFKPCGPITVQLIKERETGINWYIEINPRYGGGAPLSMKAGADSAEALLRLCCGEAVSYRKTAAADGAVYSRFDQSVCVEVGKRNAPERLHEVKAVIFDLDDTLYPEKAYVRNGFTAVADLLPTVPFALEKLWEAFERGLPAIDFVLEEAQLTDNSLRNKCLRVYREQSLPLDLYPGVRGMLAALRERGYRLGIITDGRPNGQRNKIQSLGLPELVDEIIITDELGGPQFRKPNDIAFRIMQGRMDVPYSSMVYVGDNPQKDFVAPDKLGMQSVYFRNMDGLYSKEKELGRITVQSVVEVGEII